MKLIPFIFLILLSDSLLGQNDDVIMFRSPLKIVAIEKINSDIKKGNTLYIDGLIWHFNEGYPTIGVSARNEQGTRIEFNNSHIYKFEFKEIDNLDKVWDKNSILSGAYNNLLLKKYQYEIRNDLNTEAIDYINTLNTYDRFYKDDYFEDYLYTIANKIHRGVLNDKRPGNLSIKIIKDPEPNAVTLPNGCIIISTGLLSTIQSEDELVGILAHEIAHFVLDHSILNFNIEVEQKKRAEFWSAFATVVAASADVYLAVNNKNYIPGILTVSTAIGASLLSEDIIKRLGVKYSQSQESEADNTAKEILEVLKYDNRGLSVALYRIKNYCTITGNYLALSGSGTHPSLDYRIDAMGLPSSFDTFSQPSFLKKVSLINSYNAWIELWHYSHHIAANNLVTKNIENNIATESDYIVKAIVIRRLTNTRESNEEVIVLLNKAKSLNITPFIMVHKEEGITYIRLNKKEEAKKAFQSYLASLLDTKSDNKFIEDEIIWTKKMIYKVDHL
jgi:Zn-dependent protease with chaperone function